MRPARAHPYHRLYCGLPAKLLEAVITVMRAQRAQSTPRAGETSGHRSVARVRSLEVTLASIGDAVIITDLHGRMTFMNSVAEALTGWTIENAQRQ